MFSLKSKVKQHMVSAISSVFQALPNITNNVFGTAGGREIFNRAVSNAFSWYHYHGEMPAATKKFLASMSAVGDLIDIVWAVQFIPYFTKVIKSEKIKLGRVQDLPRFAPNAKGPSVGPTFAYFGAKSIGKDGKTAFMYHWKNDRLKAVKNLFFAFATAKGVGSFVFKFVPVSSNIGNKQFIKPVLQAIKPIWEGGGKKVFDNSGSAALAIAYGATALRSSIKLWNLDQSLSRSASKEFLNASAAATLAFCHVATLLGTHSVKVLTGATVVGGVLGLMSIIAVEVHKVWRTTYQNSILDVLAPLSRVQPTVWRNARAGVWKTVKETGFMVLSSPPEIGKTAWYSLNRFKERLLHPDYFANSIGDLDALAKTTTCLNGIANNILTFFGSKDHPAYIAFAASVKGINGLLGFKHAKYWNDEMFTDGVYDKVNGIRYGNILKTLSGPCFQFAHGAEVLNYMHTSGLIDISGVAAKMAKTPILSRLHAIGLSSFKNWVVITGATLGVLGVVEFFAYRSYQYYRTGQWSKLTEGDKESQFISAINAITKAAVVYWAEQESLKLAIPLTLRMWSAMVLGLTNIDKNLMNEEKSGDKGTKRERRFATAFNNLNHGYKKEYKKRHAHHLASRVALV